MENLKLVLVLIFLQSFTDGYRQSLNGNNWSITGLSSNLSSVGQVPGTIHTILLASKKINDPYSALNDVDIRYLVYDNWIFQLNFTLEDTILASDQITLQFDQIDTVANIVLNGEVLGQTNSMFIPYRFSLNKTALKTSDNILEIQFESPIIYASNQSSAYNQTVFPLCPLDVQHGECHVQFIRKEPCSFSWDWGPAFAPIGIPGNIYIDGVNQTDIVIRLESMNLAAYDDNQKSWSIDVFLTSENDLFMSQLKFELINTTWSFETNSTFNKSLQLKLNIMDNFVQRWWPNGYGAQNLYELNVSNDGKTFGSRLIGFRTVELVQDSYANNITGLSFYFRINSKPIFIKGSNWIPSDAFQERVTDAKLERLLKSAQLANMNMLRVWGGGIYERDSFYDIADQLGIMLWHDFMFACSLYPVDQSFLTNVQNEVIYQVKRLQHHSSIVLWSGNNENEAAVAQNWYHVQPEDLPKVKDDYRILYVQTVMQTLQMIDLGKNRPFVTSSPSNGLQTVKESYIAQNPQDTHFGDVHFYGYSEDTWNTSTYPITRFLSETGVQSLPSLDTWKEATTNMTDLRIDSEFVNHREHSPNQTQAMIDHIDSNFQLPATTDPLTNFTHLIYLSQINQAMTLKSISDHCRFYSPISSINQETSEGNTMGLMYWQINDIWQAPTWSTIEYNLKWKMAHYYVKHMYSPIYIIMRTTSYLPDANDQNAQVSISLLNELSTEISGEMICSTYGLDQFLVRLLFVFEIKAEANSLEYVADLPYSRLLQSGSLNPKNYSVFHCTFTAIDSTVYSQTLFLTRPKNYQLYPSNVQVESFQELSTNDIEINLTADRPALFVWLEYTGNNTVYFSKNGFHIFDQTTKVVMTSWDLSLPLNELKENLKITTLYDSTLP